MMNKTDRGSKHTCPECETKYYDLRRDIIACPRCGAKPRAAQAPKAAQAAAKTGRSRLWR